LCGIAGYTGRRTARDILLNSLTRLEYRGYDSCGIAITNPGMSVFKDCVRVSDLAKLLPRLPGRTGIGHTRWATHGIPSKKNAHPQTDCTGHIALVHNGIILNYQNIRAELIREGHLFISETDSEVIAHLVEKYYQSDLLAAVTRAIKDLRGSYALAVMLEGKEELVITRQESPLVVGIGDRENFIASDVPALLDYTSRVIYLEDGDTGIITPDEVRIFHDDHPVQREIHQTTWSIEQAQKGGYEHFLLKEIHEQPKVLRETITEYITSADPVSSLFDTTSKPSVIFLACGTSHHAALIGKYIWENLLGLPARIDLASEFNYLAKIPSADYGICLTQSGETQDTLKAMKRLKQAGIKVITITNTVASTASKIADCTLYTCAGPEISVAATKTFMCQLLALYWITANSPLLDTSKSHNMMMSIRQLPGLLQEVLNHKDQIMELAELIGSYENIFYIGRGINYPVAMEGALKLKEVAYIHSEAYAAGEIKHGPLALVGAKTPVLALMANDNTRDAMLTSIKEIKSRGAPVLAISDESRDLEDMVDAVITIPSVEAIFSPFLNTLVVQLLAYYAARKRGCPIDFPRNLAKSVTVE